MALDSPSSAQTFQDNPAGLFDPATTTDGLLNQTGPTPKTLSDLKKMFDDYRTTTANNRMQGLIDIDYYDAKQLTPIEVDMLQKRGQPPIVINRCRIAINGVLGVIARSPTDPRCWPRNPQDEDSSSVATDVLRYVAETAKVNRLKVDCAKDNLLGGTCAALIGIDSKLMVTVDQIRWEEFFCDPRSRRPDCKDARYMGLARWMFIDDIQKMYPEQRDDLENVTQGGSANLGATDESFQDRPVNQGWIDLRNKRALMVEIYYLQDQTWQKACFYYGGVLEQGESPYTDADGKPDNPIEAQSCYVDRDNNRYGYLRDMRDIQDEINKRRSKLLHVVNSSQIQARDPSAIEVDANVAREEAARPDGVIPYGWEKVPTTDIAQGQQILLTEAKNEMERFGPNPAVLGRQGSDSSGRALLARQQAGLVELAVILDQLQDFELRIYKAMWARVKQFWKAPQFIRVTDDEGSPKFVGINEPIPNPQAGQPQVDPQTQQPVQDPTTGAPQMHGDVLGYKNNVAEMNVDIIIDTSPATATIMQEQFKDLMDLVASNPTYQQQVPFTLFLELMPGVPRKRQLIAQIQAYSAQVAQQNAAQQQQQQQLQTQEITAKIEDMASKGLLNRALAQKAVGDTHATAARTATNTNTALVDATAAHEEANTHRYEVLAIAANAAAEKDAAGGKGE